MNKEEKEFFYSIGRGSLNLNGKFYYGLDCPITDFMKSLEQENQKCKEVIDKVSSQIKLYGKYNGEKCTRGFSMMSADFNKLLEILKEVE